MRTAGRPPPRQVGRDEQHADPFVLGRIRSVRTNVSRKSASWAPEVHTFWPFTTKWSPSRTARVRREAKSDPALGSLIPSDAVFSPLSTGTAHWCFCSSDPNEISDAAMMFTPCGLKLW